MKCEVVAIGTELLLGQIVDTNSSWIGEQLALSGIDSHYQVKVGDNFDRMEDCIRLALERNDAVICCGGLGPTQDDITRNVLAKIMGAELVRDDAIGERIRKMFESRGRTMSENNLLQADVPVGATTIPQMPGTAPGLVCPVGDKVIYAVPGVPYEMREMVEGTVLPDLRRRSGQTAVIRSRVLRTWGASESGLAETLAGRIEELDGRGNPTLAFQASGIEGIKVRITAKADDAASAEAAIAEEEAHLRGLLGDLVFGVDEQSMETIILEELAARSKSLAVAESLTGGVMSARLTDIDGEHHVFRGAMIVAPGEGGESPEEQAENAAITARHAYGADIGIAAVDAAPHQRQTRGTVILAIAMGDETISQPVLLPGDRNRLRNFAVISLLDLLRRNLPPR